jgi:hypothetical protein
VRITRYDLEELLDGLNMDREDTIKTKYRWTGGATCVGLIFDRFDQWEKLLVQLAVLATEEENRPGGPNHRAFRVRDIEQMIDRARRDDHGHGVMVFWPYGGLDIIDD